MKMIAIKHDKYIEIRDKEDMIILTIWNDCYINFEYDKEIHFRDLDAINTFVFRLISGLQNYKENINLEIESFNGLYNN